MQPSKLPHKWSVLILCALVSCVYLIRTTSPGSTNRSLQAVAAQSTMCVGVDTSESFTQTQIDMSNNIDKYLSSVRGGNQLLDDINSADTEEDFVHEYGKSLLPFIAIGLVLSFFSIVCICCHCCDYKCMRGCSSPTKLNKFLCMGLAVLFSLAMVALAGAGLYFTGGMDTGYQKGTCSLSNFIVEFSAGNSDLNWIGLAPAVNTIQNVTNSINDTINGLPDPDETHTSMTNYYNTLNSSIQSYYTNSQGQTVANPADTSSTITPGFIAALGPYTNNSTLSGAIAVEAWNKYDVVDTILQSLGTVINTLQQNSASISSTLQEGVNTAQDLNNKVNDILTDFENYSDTGKKVNNGVSLAIMIFFILAILLSVIILLGVLNTFTCKFRWYYKLMVFTRYFLNVVLFLSALVLAIAWPASVAAMEACNAIKQVITNDTTFNNTFPNGTIIDVAYTCFYGDGDVLASLGIADPIQDLASVFESNQTLAEYMTMSDSEIIPGQQLYVGLYKAGELPVTAAVATDLNTLNGYTNTSSACSLDTWVLNSINCTSSMGAAFNPSQPTNNYGNPTCIGFNQFSTYTGSDRYTSGSCPNINGVPLVNGFETHLNQVNTVFGTLQTDLNIVSSNNANFMSEVRNVITPFATVGDTINDILQTVGNSQTGIIANMNCAFIGANTHSVVDDICIGYLPLIFETCIFLFFFLLISILGLSPIFFAGKIQVKTIESADNTLDDSFHKKFVETSGDDDKLEIELATIKKNLN